MIKLVIKKLVVVEKKNNNIEAISFAIVYID